MTRLFSAIQACEDLNTKNMSVDMRNNYLRDNHQTINYLKYLVFGIEINNCMYEYIHEYELKA